MSSSHGRPPIQDLNSYTLSWEPNRINVIISYSINCAFITIRKGMKEMFYCGLADILSRQLNGLLFDGHGECFGIIKAGFKGFPSLETHQ